MNRIAGKKTYKNRKIRSINCEKYSKIYIKNGDGEEIEFLVDIDDVERIKSFEYKWIAKYMKNTNSYYGLSTVFLGRDENNKRKYKTYLLHRFVIDAED